MPKWDSKPRATVPSAAMQASLDILPATPATAAESPFPLGLGLYATPPDKPTIALSLFYVSPPAAEARAPSAHRQNPPGVRPGWYVVARANDPFRVHITRVNDAIPGKPAEEYMSTSLYVDGASTHSYKVFCRCDPRQDYREPGFVHRDLKGDHFDYHRYFRPFVFRKAGAAEDAADDPADDVGTVRLRVYVGEPVPRDSSHTMRTQKYDIPAEKDVSEKTAVKQGKSLRLATNGASVGESCSLSTWTAKEKRHVPEAGVEIFVRELSWLRSRRIVDDEGRAVDAEMFRSLLKKDNARSPASHVKREIKKIKLQPTTVNLVEEPEGGESPNAHPSSPTVVDLT